MKMFEREANRDLNIIIYLIVARVDQGNVFEVQCFRSFLIS